MIKFVTAFIDSVIIGVINTDGYTWECIIYRMMEKY